MVEREFFRDFTTLLRLVHSDDYIRTPADFDLLVIPVSARRYNLVRVH